MVEAQLAHLRLEAEIGGYEAADRAATSWTAPTPSLAALLSAEPDEIAVVENATRAFDMAFYAFRFRAGDRILTSVGGVREQLPGLPPGGAADGGGGGADRERGRRHDLAARAARVPRPGRSRPLVALTHVPTNGGLVNPAAEVGRACREAGVPFLLDACQSAGQMPLDVEVLGCDVLSATARKFLRGPRGVGFLYVRRSLLDGSSRPSSTSTPPPGPPATATSCARTRSASRTGKATSPRRSAWARRWTTPWPSACPRSATAWWRSRTGCARRLADLPGVDRPRPGRLDVRRS